MHIPKLCFTYWEGNQLSLLHYYTIFSLVKYNPTIKIIIYTSKKKTEKLREWITREHYVEIINTISLDSILSISKNITLVEIDFELEYNINSDISIIYKADFIRIAKLYEHGGIWFDFDILFIKEIPSYFFESNYDLYYFSYSDTIPTGLIIISPKHKLLEILFDAVKEIIHKTNSNLPYQSLGPSIWKEFFEKNSDLLKNSLCLSNSIVYPYISIEIFDLFKNYKDNIKEDTIGIHWFNGASMARHYINRLNINNLNIDEDKCIITKYLHNIIN